MNYFFIIYPPGLEQIGKHELIEKFKIHFQEFELRILEESTGGILIECPFLQGLALNLILKCPSRILLRIDEFKCRDTPKLFNKIKKIPWNKYLLNHEIHVESSASKSRLFDSRKIDQTCTDAIANFFHSNPQKKKYLDMAIQLKKTPTVFIRFEKDICTVSIDTSGELLHFRGRKTLTALAPIRENIACALIYSLIENLGPIEWTLIDPMCGSGTFLIEASLLHKSEENRHFMFELIPIFLELKIQLHSITKNQNAFFSHLFGYEINDSVLVLCRENINEHITVSQGDIFKSIYPDKLYSENRVVIVNPPYGIRVKTEEIINSAYYTELSKKIWTNFRPKRLGIIVPSEYQFNPIKEFTIIQKLKFKNGGIPVSFYILESK